MTEPQMSLQEIADMAKRAELYGSIEFKVAAYHDIVCKSYLVMTNTKSGLGHTHAEARQALEDIRKISREWYDFMILQLNGFHIEDWESRDVNHRIEPNLTSYMLNCGQYIYRFSFSPRPSAETQWRDWKMQNLTCVAQMVKNLVYVADAAKLEDFTGDPFAFC